MAPVFETKGNDRARWEKLLAALDDKLQFGLLEHLGARDGAATGPRGPGSSKDPGGGDATSQRQPEGSTA